MKKIGIVSIIMLLTLFLSSCSQTIITEVYQSSNSGELAVTDGENIYYVQKDGIYITDLKTKNHYPLKKTQNVTLLSVDNNTIAYVREKNKSSHEIIIQDLRESTTEYDSIIFYSCNNIYLTQDALYIYGIYQQSEEPGLYIYRSNEKPLRVTDNMCQNQSEFLSIYKYEDKNIIWYTEKRPNDLTGSKNIFYLKKYDHQINRFHWSMWDTALLIPQDDNILALKGNQLIRISDKEEMLLTLPEETQPKGAVVQYSGYRYLTDGTLLLFGQCYKNVEHNAINRPLNNHLYDIVYSINTNNYNISQSFKTLDPGARVLYADKNKIIVLKENKIYLVRDFDSQKEDYVEISSLNKYTSNLTITVCADILLFFDNGSLLQSVSLSDNE